MKIRSLDDIISTVTTEISGWDESQTLEVEMRRPQLYAMLADGRIPNPLIDVVEKLFTATYKPEDAEMRAREAEGLREMARQALVKPTYDEIREHGLELTDRQLLEIYSFTLSGVNGLKAFRGREDGRDMRDGADAARAAE